MKKKDIQSDLLLSTLNGIRAVADVTANSEGIVTTDRACVSQSTTTSLAKPRADSPTGEARGLVAPSMTRPVLTASSPCQTMATTGPDAMYLTRPGKKGLPLRSA